MGPAGKEQVSSRRASLNLAARVGSAVVLAAVVIAMLALGRPTRLLLAGLLLAFSLYEVWDLSRRLPTPAPAWLLFPAGYLVTFYGLLFPPVPFDVLAGVLLVVTLIAMLAVPAARIPFGSWAVAVGAAIYVGLPIRFLLLLAMSPRFGFWLVVVPVAAAFLGDAAALFAGTRFGRHRFFPTISPKKTVEGAVAALLVTEVVATAGLVVLGVLPVLPAIAAALLIAIGAQAGDLVESQFKRAVNVKDSSSLIPGHGGFLDRLDSVQFPPILLWAYLAIFQIQV